MVSAFKIPLTVEPVQLFAAAENVPPVVSVIVKVLLSLY